MEGDEEHLVVASRPLENATYLLFEEKDVTYCGESRVAWARYKAVFSIEK